MRKIRVGGAALNQTPLDWPGNRQRIAAALAAARAVGVQLLCLPELCISGYGCEDAFFHRHITHYSLQSLLDLLPATRGLVVAMGLPLQIEGNLYNCAALCADGRLLGVYAKQHLAGDGLHYEPRWFKPWQGDNRLWEHPLLAAPIEVGPQLIEVDGIRIGFEICEDAWSGNRAGIQHYRQGVDVILNPSASHFAFGKTHTRQAFVLEGSRAFGCTYVLANLQGNEAGRSLYDGEVLIAQCGRWYGQNRRFQFGDFSLTHAIIDLYQPRTQRQRLASHPSSAWAPVPQVQADVLLPLEEPNTRPQVLSTLSKEEELYQAVTLGLWDYMRKSHSRGFVVSLSGGADSAACALLAARALHEARQALGEEAACAQAGLHSLEAHSLLHCVYQATDNSSADTLASAQALAENLGARFHHWQVQPLYQQYTQLAADALGRSLDWQTDDIALQNIQARLRAPGAWLLANLTGGLLLSTSNRSEIAVGYATMDGDTAGGLAPIAGLDKAYLRKWLRWAQQALQLPGLAAVNAMAPTAELRPPARRQTDEEDLMPYPLLDAIERAAWVEGLPPLQVYQSLLGGSWTEQQLRQGIVRFFRLWSRNQWKRERYAPGFHLDSHNLDPRSWYRHPILSGGWEQELRELEEV